MRDLLAITRILYRERVETGAPARQLVKLEEAGKAFRQALELSVHDPYALGHRAAWNWANKGIELLGEVLSERDSSAKALVKGAEGVLKRVNRP